MKNTQKIDISKIISNICNINNKSNTYNNEFYICQSPIPILTIDDKYE